MSRELEYNAGITEEVLGRKERLNPEELALLTYGRPGDTCQIGDKVFPAGWLGNMSGGFRFTLLDKNWYASEFFYLCGEWSDNTDKCIEAQNFVLKMKSGCWAKRYSKAKYKKDIRPDFATFRLQWMLWCVWQKCRLNKERRKNQKHYPEERFAELLMSVPDNVVIAEVVPGDPVWAVYPDESGMLFGGNAMGKILTICRRHLINGTVPTIDTGLLNASNIHILGHRIRF